MLLMENSLWELGLTFEGLWKYDYCARGECYISLLDENTKGGTVGADILKGPRQAWFRLQVKHFHGEAKFLQTLA